MKLTCPECQHSATIDPARIPACGARVRCPKCSARFVVNAPPPTTPSPEPAEAPTPPAVVPNAATESLLVVCPSCRHEQPLSAECRRCGVIFARHRPRTAKRATPSPPPPPPRRKSRRPLFKIGIPLLAALALLVVFLPRFYPSLTFFSFQAIDVSAVKPAKADATWGEKWEDPNLPRLHFYRIAAGFEHAAAIDRYGMVWSWGENNSGQLASCKTGSANRPRPVRDRKGKRIGPAVQVAAGTLHTLAVMSDGTLWIWGLSPGATPYENSSRTGRNGVWGGGPHNNIQPTQIEGINDAAAVAVWEGGRPVFIVLHRDGGLSLFGDSADNLPLFKPRRLSGLTEVSAISAGRREVALLKRDGTVWTWQGSDLRLLSSDPLHPGPPLHQVEGLHEVGKVVAGNDATVVIQKDGSVWGWGENLHARLPSGLIVRDARAPTQIPGLVDIVDLAALGCGYVNAGHFLALDRQGRVWSWGFNQRGQLGQGGSDNAPPGNPAQVAGLDDISGVAAGGMFSLALDNDGTLWSWGNNSSGQLGDLTGNNQSVPVRVALPGDENGGGV